MNIGRKPLTDAEFNSQWAVLYQEFHTLAVTNRCNASLVYNTIYTICTSSIPYEDRLYWRIGDFLYSRCREHRAAIQGSDDRIKAYSQAFCRYETLVRAINRLGCFLNECITARKLDDFGYLLWDRCVIQDMPGTFFIDVFSHASPMRIAAVRSFSLVVPDPNDPLLYYRERYEKPALEIIRQRYVMVPRIEDLLLFSQTVHAVVMREREHFDEYFLPDTFSAHEAVLSECLFGTQGELITASLKDLISYENSPRLDAISTSTTRKVSSQPVVGDGITEMLKPILEKKQSRENKDAKDVVPRSFDHSKTTPWPEPRKSGFCDEAKCQPSTVFGTVYRQLCVLETGFYILKRAYSLYVIEAINAFQHLLSGSIEDVFNLFNTLDIFDTTDDPSAPYADFHQILSVTMKHTLMRIKPCFITRLCLFTDNLAGAAFVKIDRNRSLPMLSSETRAPAPGRDQGIDGRLPDGSTGNANSKQSGVVFDRHRILVGDSGNQRVHTTGESTALDSTGASAPGILTASRLSGVLDRHPIAPSRPGDEDLSQIRPFSSTKDAQDPYAIFKQVMKLVTDRREFITIYLSVLKDRLLERRSNLNLERQILGLIGIQSDERANTMIEDIDMSTDSLKILNASYWGLEPENGEMNIPEPLAIKLRIDFLNTQSKNGGCFGPKDTELSHRRDYDRARPPSNTQIKYAHQYSTVVAQIEGVVVKMNVYQYTVLYLLSREDMPFQHILDRTRMKEDLLKEVLNALVETGLLVLVDRIYSIGNLALALRRLESDLSSNGCALEDNRLNISRLKSTKIHEQEICLDSYFLSLSATVLKRSKSLKKVDFADELTKLSRFDINENKMSKILENVVEKGLGEYRGDCIEYIF